MRSCQKTTLVKRSVGNAMQDSCSQLQPRKRKQPEEGVATEAQQPRITAVTYFNETGQITMKKKKEPSDTAQEQSCKKKERNRGSQPRSS
jgi:hypothetical protein